MKILYEDDHILVCEKPAGIATQAGKVTEKDMVSEVNNYLRKAGAKSPAYLIHRLDKPVKGVLLFAKTKDAASNLNKQITTGKFEKKYYAIIEGKPEKSSGLLENDIYKDGNKAFICEKSSESGEIKCAKLEYTIVEHKDSAGLKDFINDIVSSDDVNLINVLDIKLLTGRFHQIRCQLSNIGCPIAGDKLYGSIVISENRKAIGLIAYSLTFNHPKTGKKMTYSIL